MTIFLSPQSLLTPEKSWNDWVRLGSLTKVRREYLANEIVNPRTGNPPTESAIQKSAYKWCTENQKNLDAARERFNHEYTTSGIIPTDELWRKKVFMMIKLLYYQQPSKMQEYLKKYGVEDAQ